LAASVGCPARTAQSGEQRRFRLVPDAQPRLAAFHIRVHGGPQIVRDDRFVPARKCLAFVRHLAEVQPVAQHREQRSQKRWNCWRMIISGCSCSLAQASPRFPFETLAAVQNLGTRAEYIKISGNGPNALDFHIACYIGQLAAADPTAYFRIVSNDGGFDPLIQHLNSKKIFAGRIKDLADIPLVKASNTKSPGEKVEIVLTKLKQLGSSKPRTVKTLSSSIGSLFQKQLGEEEVAAIVDDLVGQGHLSITGAKVSYAASAEG
jgi:PIN domain